MDVMCKARRKEKVGLSAFWQRSKTNAPLRNDRRKKGRCVEETSKVQLLLLLLHKEEQRRKEQGEQGQQLDQLPLEHACVGVGNLVLMGGGEAP